MVLLVAVPGFEHHARGTRVFVMCLLYTVIQEIAKDLNNFTSF